MAELKGTLKIRSDMLPFLWIPDDSPEGGTYHRMQGFTGFSVSKNPAEYSRQYVDESQEQTDVTGFSPSIAYGFDRYIGNEVHDFLAEIIDNELLGTAAVVNILVVDTTRPAGEDNAVLRPYAVIADTEGDQMDAYTYSGNFRVKGTKTWGTSVVSEDGLTATFQRAA